jgi:GGDEF domain-containing protein
MLRRGQQDELLREVTWLRARVAELEADRARGLRLDSVTGLLSARAFRGRLSEEVERARRYQRPLSLVVISIDDYGSLELRHGFKAGDHLLVAVSKRLTSSTRSHDLAKVPPRGGPRPSLDLGA